MKTIKEISTMIGKIVKRKPTSYRKRDNVIPGELWNQLTVTQKNIIVSENYYNDTTAIGAVILFFSLMILLIVISEILI